MKQFVGLIVGIGILFGSSIAAHADAKDNVINHIADAMAVDLECSRLEANYTLMGMAAAYYKIKMKDIQKGGKYYKRISQLVSEKRSKLAGSGEEAICAIGDMLYGEEGMNVPQLLIPE